MTWLVINLITYAVVSASLVAVWVLTQGSIGEVQQIVEDPTLWRSLGFWPIWVILGWGVAVVIHAGIVLSVIAFGWSRRREKRRLRAAKTEAKIREHLAAASHGDLVRSTRGERAPEPAAPKPQTRTWVTVMFVDIVSSTHLNEEFGDDEWTAILSQYRELVRTRLLERAGQEVGTQGDGFLARFANPAEAVLCAVDIQSEMEQQLATEVPLRVRIGVHAGEAVENDGDLIGRVINVAARVTSEAEAGEILVTEPVADYTGTRLQLQDRGLHELKGVSQPRHLLAVVWSPDPGRTPATEVLGT